MSSSSSNNNKNVENARRFLWDEDESVSTARSRASSSQMSRGGMSGVSGGFSTRDYVVDQSVNLMDIGEEAQGGGGGGGGGGTTRLSAAAGGGGGTGGANTASSMFSSINMSGLFRANTGVSNVGIDEYGDAEPSADAEEYIDNDKRRRGRISPLLVTLRSKHCMTLLVALLGFVLVIVTITVTFTNSSSEVSGDNKNNNNNNNSNKNNNNTAGGDSRPRYVQIMTRIVDEEVTSKDMLDETSKTASSSSSPQQLALNWLVNYDPAKLPYDHPALLDRYGLAVFYYSSSNSIQTSFKQGGWKNSTNWMTSSGMCNWYGIECIPREQEATVENNYTPYTKTYDDNAMITGINLSGNNIIGYLPTGFGSGNALSELILLDIEDNELSHTLPITLGKLPKLRDLLLKGNKIVGTLPEQYGELTTLHQINLGQNQLEGSIPDSWNQLKELRYLSLSQNLLTGTNFPDLSKMTHMTGLFLEDNDLQGTLPESLGTLTDLLDLRLGLNKFSGPLTALTSLQNLETLHLNNNAFNGTIPNMFDQLFRLHELMIQRNQFVGSIPLTLTHLQSVKTLNLAYNQLDGSIPPGLGLLTDVVSMYLDHNKFNGNIPTLLGKLDDITKLTLNNNSLSGMVPTELGLCFRLIEVHLESNQLTGEIPPQLGELNSLETLRLESNKMAGVTMPPQVCALRKDDLSVLTADCLVEGDNNGEQVSCSCCTECI